jgi:hypothetical protein
MPRRLADDEKAALIELLRVTIDRDRFPLSPQIRMLKRALAKIEPQAPNLSPIRHRGRARGRAPC